MEVFFWLLSACLIFYFMTDQETREKRRTALYFGLSFCIALICSAALRLIPHVDHVSVWLAAAYALLSLQANYLTALCTLRKDRWKEALQLALKTLCGGLLLAFFFHELTIGNLNTGATAVHALSVNVLNASVLILVGTVVWLYGARFFEKHPRPAKLIHTAILLLLPFFLFFILELSWNNALLEMKLVYVLLNIALFLLLELLVLNVFWSVSAGVCFMLLGCWLIGCLNFFVVEFRGSPIMAVDLFAMQTAMAVASDYTYQINDGMGMALLLVYVIAAFTLAVSKQARTLQLQLRRTVCRAIIAIVSFLTLTVWVNFVDFEKSYSIWMDLWTPVSTYRITGFVPAFLTYMQKMKVDRPEGYSASAVTEILTPYLEEKAPDAEDEASDSEKTDILQVSEVTASGTKAEAAKDTMSANNGKAADTTAKKPTIIAIMNESFSDLNQIGPLETANEDLAFFHSLQSDPGILEYGSNYVSTRGGGTSTTEFEYLTGDSMSNVSGTNPYAEFHFSGVPNLAAFLKEQGYHTIAMHPENPVNWRRNSVYPAMGFDEFLSIDDFESGERTVWDRVSDRADYEKLIEVYEAQDSPSFIFNVTIQNHGSYGIDTLNALKEEERIDIDTAYQQYDDVRSYQSLIRKADDALEYLMDYFRSVEEPVIICFFGDHQPALNTDFETALQESGRTESDTDLSLEEKLYTTPYFIWSNFEPERPMIAAADASGTQISSTNYLGVLTRYYAGLPLTAYDRYLLAQREEIPAVNLLGYMTDDGQWHALEEETSEQSWLDKYQLIQYNTLFETEKNKQFFE